MDNASKPRKTRTKKEDINYGYDSKFPTILRALLENTTQDELAKYCDVARQSVAQWKDGKTKPDIYYLEKIARFFKVSTDYLLGLTDKRTANMEIRHIADELNLPENSVEKLREFKTSKDAEHYRTVLDYIICWNNFPDIVVSLIIAAKRYNEFHNAYPDNRTTEQHRFGNYEELEEFAIKLREASPDEAKPFIASPAEILMGYLLSNYEFARMLIDRVFDALLVSTRKGGATHAEKNQRHD